MTTTKGTTSQMASGRPGAVIHDMTRKSNVTVRPTNGLKPGLATAAPSPAVTNKLPGLTAKGVSTSNKSMMNIPGGK